MLEETQGNVDEILAELDSRESFILGYIAQNGARYEQVSGLTFDALVEKRLVRVTFEGEVCLSRLGVDVADRLAGEEGS